MANGPSGRGSDPRKRTSGVGSRGAGARPGPGPRRGTPRPRTPAAPEAPVRPRLTGRAAILVLVVALLMVSYASSMRAFLEQRHHLASLSASISTSQAEVDRLSREKKRWNDPAYVRTMAHQRFGWVLPGEIGFRVLDDNGKPLGHTDSLPAPSSGEVPTRPQWWQTAWGSDVAAGKPVVDPSDVPVPVTKIRAPQQPKSTGAQR
jgi:cell division protein FtsB